ncbi:hypothetical protein B7494_g3066 [Chlorociboria aeruginascens]|nr:hypothetical protein B7494_g3066 [Chlorociboria aeruginascens]
MQLLLSLLVLGLASTLNAHIALTWPAPFRAAYNPNSVQANIDYSITSPLSGPAQFPCKGYQTDMGTPGGASVVTWQAGGSYNFTTGSGAIHAGGSCQIGLSYDKAVSFTVIHSYLGACPASFNEAFKFDLPSDAPATTADGGVFGWLWYNKVGNREIYMDCASVTITAGSGARAAPAVAFKDRPTFFVANLNNGCQTVEGKEVVFPNPGPDVTDAQTGDNTGSFTGTCAAVNGIGGSSGSSGSAASSPASSSPSPAVVSPVAASPAASSPTTMATVYTSPSASGGVFATVSSVSDTAAPSGTSTPSSGGLTLSEDGECSGAHTCTGSPRGPCCSQWGYCGSTSEYCGTGCQADFGQCGTFVNSTSAIVSKASSSSSPAPVKLRGKRTGLKRMSVMLLFNRALLI